MPNATNNLLRNILAVVSGVLTGWLLVAIQTLFIYGYLSITETFLGNVFLVFIIYITPGFSAGYITARISERTDLLLVVYTLIILLFILFAYNDFEFNFTLIEGIGVALLVLVPVFAGGAFELRRKKRNKTITNNQPSHPDTL